MLKERPNVPAFDENEQATQDMIMAASLNTVLKMIQARGRLQFTASDAATWRTIYTLLADIREAEDGEGHETNTHAAEKTRQSTIQASLTDVLNQHTHELRAMVHEPA